MTGGAASLGEAQADNPPDYPEMILADGEPLDADTGFRVRLPTVRGSAGATPGDALMSAAPAPCAPELEVSGRWMNSEPLSLAGLRGEVVLVVFWVHSCVNCHNSLPALDLWRRSYALRGFTLVGVHTPEFTSDNDAAELRRALERDHVEWPVMQDNARSTWDAYGVDAWPTFILVDRTGRVRARSVGELSTRFPQDIPVLRLSIEQLLDEPVPADVPPAVMS